jgi:hypothetical protein
LLSDALDVGNECKVDELGPSINKAWSIDKITAICETTEADSEPCEDVVPYPDVTEQPYDPTDPTMRLKFGPRWSKWAKHSLILAALQIIDPKFQVGIFASMTDMPVLNGTADDNLTNLWPLLRVQFKHIDTKVNECLKVAKQNVVKWNSKEAMVRKILADVKAAKEHKDAEDAKEVERVRIAKEAEADAAKENSTKASKSVFH